MAGEGKGRMVVVLVRNGFVLALMVYIIFLIVKPKPISFEAHEYVGDPVTGCAYRVDKIDLDKLLAYTEEGTVSSWDELESADQARKIGYILCN